MDFIVDGIGIIFTLIFITLSLKLIWHCVERYRLIRISMKLQEPNIVLIEDRPNPGLEPEGMGANGSDLAPERESQNSRPKSLAPSTPSYPEFNRPSITEILHLQEAEDLADDPPHLDWMEIEKISREFRCDPATAKDIYLRRQKKPELPKEEPEPEEFEKIMDGFQ